MRKTTASVIVLIAVLIFLAAAIAGCAQKEVTTVKSTRTAAPAVEEETQEADVEETEYVAPKTTKTATKTTTTTTPTMSFEEEEVKAIDTAKAFVKNLDGYKNQNGRLLEVHNTAKLKCEGCWVMDMSFTRDLLYYPDKTEHIKINIELKDWKVEKYTFD